MAVNTNSLTGRDLAYWYARAGCKNTLRELSISVKDANALPRHDIASESIMRALVLNAFGASLPDRTEWR